MKITVGQLQKIIKSAINEALETAEVKDDKKNDKYSELLTKALGIKFTEGFNDYGNNESLHLLGAALRDAITKVSTDNNVTVDKDGRIAIMGPMNAKSKIVQAANNYLSKAGLVPEGCHEVNHNNLFAVVYDKFAHAEKAVNETFDLDNEETDKLRKNILSEIDYTWVDRENKALCIYMDHGRSDDTIYVVKDRYYISYFMDDEGRIRKNRRNKYHTIAEFVNSISSADLEDIEEISEVEKENDTWALSN